MANKEDIPPAPPPAPPVRLVKDDTDRVKIQYPPSSMPQEPIKKL